MYDPRPSPTGLKPTLRQGMILVAWAALLLAATRAMIGWGLFGGTTDSVCQVVAMLVGVYPMPILAGLLWSLDRPGRVRTWYGSACMIAAQFAGGLAFCSMDLACYALTGRPTMLFPMWPLVGLVGFGCGWMQWRAARPRACPSCGRCAVIPIAHPPRPKSKRLVNNYRRGWCAGCGADCERERVGAWSEANTDRGYAGMKSASPDNR